MNWLLRFFTWWNGSTLNTGLYTSLNGELVGHDEFGNAYYRQKGGAIDKGLQFQRRWVIYNGVSDGSKTPPGWYGWLHHTVDTPPTDEDYRAHPWELLYVPNMTGTPLAWRPKGSTLNTGIRAPAAADYEPWSPEA